MPPPRLGTVALGLLAVLTGVMLLLVWQGEGVLRSRSDSFLSYGNPFQGDREREELQDYIKGLRVKSGSEVRLLNSHMTEGPTALFFFHPLDCFVCLEYMRDMLETASGELQNENGNQIAVLGYDSNSMELKSLARSWGDDGDNWYLLQDAPLLWTTPFVVVLDAKGNTVFANAIINSRERQEVVLEAYGNTLSTLTDSQSVLRVTANTGPN